jgi:hypothetical protein
MNDLAEMMSPTTSVLPEAEDHNEKAASAATTPTPAASFDAITSVTSIDPKITGKKYSLGPNGELIKRVVASIREGEGRTIEATTSEAMMAVLGQTTQSTNQALILSRFNNDDAIGQPLRS